MNVTIQFYSHLLNSYECDNSILFTFKLDIT